MSPSHYCCLINCYYECKENVSFTFFPLTMSPFPKAWTYCSERCLSSYVCKIIILGKQFVIVRTFHVNTHEKRKERYVRIMQAIRWFLKFQDIQILIIYKSAIACLCRMERYFLEVNLEGLGRGALARESGPLRRETLCTPTAMTRRQLRKQHVLVHPLISHSQNN